MADTNINIQLATGFAGLTLELYPDGSDTVANSPADTLTEETNRLGLYAATVTEALDGVYFAKVLDGSTLRATGWVKLYDDTGTYHVIDDYLWASSAAASPIAPTASPAGFTTGFTYVYDEEGVVESSVTVSVYCYEVPTGSGLALDSKVRTGTTNGSGYVEFTNMIQSAKYRIKRGNGPYESFTASTDASFAIDNFLGVDE